LGERSEKFRRREHKNRSCRWRAWRRREREREELVSRSVGGYVNERQNIKTIRVQGGVGVKRGVEVKTDWKKKIGGGR